MTTTHEQDDPAAALGDIWEALDSLPRSVPSPAATATTIEMVAISAQRRSILEARPALHAWVAAAALVVAGFLGGVAVGRASAPTRSVPPLPARPFVDRDRPFSDRERPPRRVAPPRGEIPTPPR